jgi:uncharacterized membrane protein
MKTFRGFINQLRNSFGYLPAVYSVFAVLLALLTIYLDSWLEETGVHHNFPEIMLSDRELSQLIVSSLASSILTVTAIIFSTIMVVLTTYLSQYSPRTINNFLADQTTRRILAVFVSSFVYYLLVLLWMKTSKPLDYITIPSIAVLIGIINLGFFVYFIHHVGKFIQVINLIQQVTNNTILSIEKRYEEFYQTNQHTNAPWNEWETEEIKQRSSNHFLAQASGYIRQIQIKKIIVQAKLDGLIIKMEKQIGDYVDEESILFTYWESNSGDLVETAYIQFFEIGYQRSNEQDIEFGIQKLSEIGLRAISPAINDPNTAITCIHRLGKILARLGRMNIATPQYYDDEKNLRLIVLQKSFEDYLYTSFYQLRQYSTGDISVIGATIDAFIIIAENNDDTIKTILWKFSKHILSGVEQEKLIEPDLQFLNKKIMDLAKITKHHNEFHPVQ